MQPTEYRMHKPARVSLYIAGVLCFLLVVAISGFNLLVGGPRSRERRMIAGPSGRLKAAGDAA